MCSSSFVRLSNFADTRCEIITELQLSQTEICSLFNSSINVTVIKTQIRITRVRLSQMWS